MSTSFPYTVARVERAEPLTPRMRRITLSADAFVDACPVAPDQQVKLFFGRDGGRPEVPHPADDPGDGAGWYARYLAIPDAVRPWMRAYTVRHLDPRRGRMQVDIALHGGSAGAPGEDGDVPGAGRRAESAGPGSRWAAAARPGDEVGVLGPAAGSRRAPGDHPTRLLIGDATALPAIAATVEALPRGHRAVVVAAVADAAEEQEWTSEAEVERYWVHDTGPSAGTSLLDAVRAVDLPADCPFAWIAGEAGAVRALRRHLIAERGVPRCDVCFTGYWRRDVAQDDMAEA